MHSAWGVHLQLSPINMSPPKIFFLHHGGARAPSAPLATPMLSIQVVRSYSQCMFIQRCILNLLACGLSGSLTSKRRKGDIF